MSFFKDFKEDLSQAVNELLPDEKKSSKDIMAEEPQMVDTITETSTTFEKDDIASILDTIAPDVSPAPTAPQFADVTALDDGQFAFVDTIKAESESVVPVFEETVIPAATEPETPVAPITPIIPEVQVAPVVSEAPVASVIPEVQVVSAEPEIPEVQVAPVVSEAPAASVIPEVQAVPAEPVIPEVQAMPAEPEMSELFATPVATVIEPVPETPVATAAPIPTAPVMEAAKVEAVIQSVSEPKEPIAPVFEQDAPIVEEVKRPVEPVFAPSSAERPAPINTTMEDFSMETGIIIAGMTIKGDVISDGNLDVSGTVTGNITIQGKLSVTGNVDGNSQAEEVFADGAHINGEIKSNGAVKIGEGAVIKGNISATSAVLAGAVKGDIDVQGPVILDSTAIIMGNIKSKSIQINNGAVIEGLCSQCYADVSPMSFFGEDKKAK